MIKKPVLGKRVVVAVVECCCGGFKKGTVGKITEIHSDDSFKVSDSKDWWWYCRKCVSPLKTTVAAKTSLNKRSAAPKTPPKSAKLRLRTA